MRHLFVRNAPDLDVCTVCLLRRRDHQSPGDRDQRQAADRCPECGEPPHHHLVVCSRVNDVPDRPDQQQAAVLAEWFDRWWPAAGVPPRRAMFAALAAARAEEKARRDKLVTDLRALIRSHAGLSDVVSIHDLRAVLDADQ